MGRKFVVGWTGTIYDCEWFDDVDFEKLNSVSGAHGFVFNEKNEICIVKVKKDGVWSDIGGGVEKPDKTFEDTFIREVDEEADLEIKDIKRVGYTHLVPRKNPSAASYQVRFVARVKKIKPQTADPAVGTINERKFVAIKDFKKYVNWYENEEEDIRKSLEKLEKK